MNERILICRGNRTFFREKGGCSSISSFVDRVMTDKYYESTLRTAFCLELDGCCAIECIQMSSSFVTC